LNKADIKIAQVTLSPRRSWEIKTSKNLQIALGRVDMESRLNRFVSAYQSTLSQLNVKMLYADLRYPNGFAVRRPITIKPAIKPTEKSPDKSPHKSTIKPSNKALSTPVKA
jgi:cell division protein FtsQ